MTPSELEAMVRNLNTRTTAIEQILPTLATKEDLTTGLNGLEGRLGTRIDGVETRLGGVENRVDALKSHTLTLLEKVKDDYDVLAGHLANVPSDIRRLTEQGAGLKVDIQLLAESLARISRDLGDKIGQLSQKIDQRPRRS